MMRSTIQEQNARTARSMNESSRPYSVSRNPEFLSPVRIRSAMGFVTMISGQISSPRSEGGCASGYFLTAFEVAPDNYGHTRPTVGDGDGTSAPKC